MHEVVRSIEKWKPPRAPRLPSLAGSGLPERMRTTAFAFLGLTTAAGLALVAIFAQLGFHVLSPAPLPSEPVEKGTVARAVAVDRVTGRHQQGPALASVGARAGGPSGFPRAGEPATPEPPVPGGAAPSEGGVAPETSSPPVTKPTSVPPSPPSSTPAGTASPPAETAPKSAPTPAPVPARPAVPAPAPAPGNSQSSAAAEHASDRGVEASSKQTASVQTSPPATSSSSPPSGDAAPGNGNGKALGQAK